MQVRYFFVAKNGTFLEASNVEDFWPVVREGAPSDRVLEVLLADEHHFISATKYRNHLSTAVEAGVLQVISYDAVDKQRVLIQYGSWAFAQEAPVSEHKLP